MKFINHSGEYVTIGSKEVSPLESYEYSENIFDTINIHSEFGSCEITCEYTSRFIHNYGKMIVKIEDNEEFKIYNSDSSK